MRLFAQALRGRNKFISSALLCGGLLLSLASAPGFAHSTTGSNESYVAVPTGATQAQLEGELEVLHSDDFKNKKSHTWHTLKTASGERYVLIFKGKVPQDPSGTKLRIKGQKSGNTLYLDLASGGTTSYQVLAAPAPGLNSIGTQNTAVLLVNFQDQPTNKPQTTDQWNNFMFGTASGTVNNFMLENSYQQASLTGKVFGWYTLPINSTDPCSTDNIASAAKAAAAAAGVDLTPYNRLVFAFPANSCSWSGLSSVGSTPSQSFINGGMSLYVVTHEMGHALGLFHSHGLDCDVSAIGNNCTYLEYGDSVDTMGGGNGHFSAVQKERLGWLNYNTSPPITTVQNSGSYVIEPIETASTNNPKGLKILKSTDPTTGAKTWYYLEYRQAVGVDAYISTSSIYYPQNILAGVLVHTGTDGTGNSNYMLDMTPGSLTAYSGEDLYDAALVVGQTYTDPNAGVTITPTWANSTGIGVNITLASSTACKRANPSVALSSASSSVLAGASVTYTVAVTNNDSSSCSASTFNLQGALPSGWTGVWSASSLNISAGSAASVNLAVTSSTSSIAGTYSVSSTATNSSATTYTGSGSATYIIGTSSSTTTTKTKGKVTR